MTPDPTASRRFEAAFLELEYDKDEDFNGRWNPVGGFGWEDQVKQDVTTDFIGVELRVMKR